MNIPGNLSSQASAIVDCGLRLAIVYIVSTHIKPAVRYSTEVYYYTIIAISQWKIFISRIVILHTLHSCMRHIFNIRWPELDQNLQ